MVVPHLHATPSPCWLTVRHGKGEATDMQRTALPSKAEEALGFQEARVTSREGTSREELPGTADFGRGVTV